MSSSTETQNPRWLVAPLRGYLGKRAAKFFKKALRLQQTGTAATTQHGTTHAEGGREGEVLLHLVLSLRASDVRVKHPVAIFPSPTRCFDQQAAVAHLRAPLRTSAPAASGLSPARPT